MRGTAGDVRQSGEERLRSDRPLCVLGPDLQGLERVSRATSVGPNPTYRRAEARRYTRPRQTQPGGIAWPFLSAPVCESPSSGG